METVEVDTTRKLAKQSKCAHAECSCTVTSDEQFCSDHCASHADDDADQAASSSAASGQRDCGCGHAECVATAAATEGTLPPAIGTA